MNKVHLYGLMIIAMISGAFMHARIKEVRNERSFTLKMEETPFAVLLFYCSGTADKDTHRMIRHLKRDLQYVVEAGLYQNARVGLFAIDVARDKLNSVADALGVDQYPTIMMFKGNGPVKNKNGNITVLRGFASRTAIRAFIDKNIRGDVLDFMQDQQERSDARAQADRTHIYFSYGMTLPASVQYGYPYYYSPYPYYGYAAPGIGVQMGF